MHFLHPEFFYYMLPPMFILFGLLLSQKGTQEIFFSQEVMDKLRVSSNMLTLKARNGLFFLIGILMVVALAGPVLNDGKIEVKAKSADIMIALDISDSMLAEDVYPNRLKLAKQKVLTLLHEAPTERIGVIAFAKNSYLVSPLSFDSGAVSFLLRSLSTDSITEKGTNFLSMLKVVDQSIKDKDKRYLLILTDGGDKSDFSKEISFAKEHHIVVFVLGMGTSKGAPIKREDGTFIKQNGTIIVSKLNPAISKLATSTGGVYIESVNSDKDIKMMLKEIESHSEKKVLKSQEIERFIPLFYYPLGLALFLLLIATSSMSKRERVNVPALFLLAVIMGQTPTLHAGVLDFMKLDEAKSAYDSGSYAKSQKLYEKYANESQNAEVNYNVANTLYKQGKYKEAVKSYEKAVFNDKTKRAKNYANLGNAYVKSKDKDSLAKAIKAYEESLKIKEDKETRENLEAVKKAQKKQKNKQKKNKKNSKDKKKNKDQKNRDKKKQNKDSDKQDKDKKKNSQEKQKKSDKDKKQKNKSDKKNEDEQKKKDAQKKDEKQKSQEQKKKEQEKKKNKAEELKENNTTAQPQEAQNIKQMKMSKEEEKKWLKKLQKNQSTFLYKLNKTNKLEENSDEKPW